MLKIFRQPVVIDFFSAEELSRPSVLRHRQEGNNRIFEPATGTPRDANHAGHPELPVLLEAERDQPAGRTRT